jgi:methionine-rich copper-binding protein CopC
MVRSRRLWSLGWGNCLRRLGVAVVLLIAVVAEAVPAYAHSELRASRPAHGQRLDVPPATLELHFNEKVQVTAVRLYDGAGKEQPIARDRALRENATYTAPAPEMPPGTYRIEWRAISADGHPVGGTIRFQIGTAR